MADKLVPSRNDTGVIERYRDMGDGSFARVTSAAAGSAGAAGYPAGAVPVAATANGANSSAVATLPAAAGKTTYISGLQVTGAGATGGSLGGVTLSGILGGGFPLFFTVPAGTTISISPLAVTFNPPLPATGANVAIAATLNAFGAGNPTAQVSVQGFQL